MGILLGRGQITVTISEKGEPGATGASIVFRGAHGSSIVYYNNTVRRDVVKYDSVYYIYKGINGASSTWSNDDWENFGADFDSVATKVLFSEEAYIDNLIAEKVKTALSGQRITINDNNNNKMQFYNSKNEPTFTLSGDDRNVGLKFAIADYSALPSIILTPSYPNVQYVHIKYSSTSDGNNICNSEYKVESDRARDSFISINPYIGICASNSSTPSTAPSDYNWYYKYSYMTKGLLAKNISTSQNIYLHIKYAEEYYDNGVKKRFTFNYSNTSRDGSTEGSHIGVYINQSISDVTSLSLYTWSEITDKIRTVSLTDKGVSINVNNEVAGGLPSENGVDWAGSVVIKSQFNEKSDISMNLPSVIRTPLMIMSSNKHYDPCPAPSIYSLGGICVNTQVGGINNKDNNILHGVVAMGYIMTGTTNIWQTWISSMYPNIVITTAVYSTGSTRVMMNPTPFTHRDQYQVLATVNDTGTNYLSYVGVIDKWPNTFLLQTGNASGSVNKSVFFMVIDMRQYICF